MDWKKSIEGLQCLIIFVSAAGIKDSKLFRDWKKKHAAFVAECLGYERQPGMPEAKDLINAQFHSELPLVILNYTQGAFVGLKDDPRGWTAAIRSCRGIVFDRSGELVALPFEKFFSYGSGHPETRVSLDSDFVATVMQDGSPGVIFRYRDRFLFAARDGFSDRMSVFSQSKIDMLARRNRWYDSFPDGVSVIVDTFPKSGEHAGESYIPDIVVVGVRNVRTLEDYGPHRFQSLAARLGLLNTAIWGARTIDDLRRYIQDDSNCHLKGFVVKFPDGTRVKFECRGYRS